MKKKIIAMLMAAVMVTSMTACGDKKPEESVSVSGQAEQDNGQESGREEEGTENSDMESNSKDTPDAAGGNDDVGEPVTDDSNGTESGQEDFDWASVNWNKRSCILWRGDFMTYGELRGYTKWAIKSGKTKEDLIEGAQIAGYEDLLLSNYDDWDEETKVLFDELMKLSKDEFIHMEETYIYAEEKASVETKCEGFDWSSVDWTQTITVGDPPQTLTLSQIIWNIRTMAENTWTETGEPVDETVTVEELMEGNSAMAEAYRAAGITYDSFDEYVKTVLNEEQKLSYNELGYLSVIYEFWQETN